MTNKAKLTFISDMEVIFYSFLCYTGGNFFNFIFMDIHENWCSIAYILIYVTNYVADHLVKAREREVIFSDLRF